MLKLDAWSLPLALCQGVQELPFKHLQRWGLTVSEAAQMVRLWLMISTYLPETCNTAPRSAHKSSRNVRSFFHKRALCTWNPYFICLSLVSFLITIFQPPLRDMIQVPVFWTYSILKTSFLKFLPRKLLNMRPVTAQKLKTPLQIVGKVNV